MKRLTLSALVLGLVTALPALAGDITVEDSFARAAGANAKAGAAFMRITNGGERAERLLGARSDAAKMVEIHTHKEDANGVMQMIHVEEGFEIPAGASLLLKRGGDHVMLMGLTGPLTDGGEVEITLEFEQAGEMTVIVPVDNARME